MFSRLQACDRSAIGADGRLIHTSMIWKGGTGVNSRFAFRYFELHAVNIESNVLDRANMIGFIVEPLCRPLSK
jgi:hypothetical protein